jgi:hypothetical protein
MNSFTLELWQVITLCITIVGSMFGLVKMLLAQQLVHLDAAFAAQNERLGKIEQTNMAEVANWQRLERELMRLQADMPVAYVRRDDYIRGQSVLESKIDGLAVKLENVQLRALLRNHSGDAA